MVPHPTNKFTKACDCQFCVSPRLLWTRIMKDHSKSNISSFPKSNPKLKSQGRQDFPQVWFLWLWELQELSLHPWHAGFYKDNLKHFVVLVQKRESSAWCNWTSRNLDRVMRATPKSVPDSNQNQVGTGAEAKPKTTIRENPREKIVSSQNRLIANIASFVCLMTGWRLAITYNAFVC